MLKDLFGDEERLARLSLDFIVVFVSFINDPKYTLRGVGRRGAQAVE